MLQKVFKDNKVLISERNDNNLFAVFTFAFVVVVCETCPFEWALCF